ncbi:MAG: hypothetical protein IKP77_01265 [Acholeplasmatales bacterium]|nr:hypothetical protein [Acholeplasmatales bacterium]
MKGYFKISAILGAIALVCAAILAALNMLTSPVIAKNDEKKETETIQAIYSNYDSEKSKVESLDSVNSAITKKITAKDSSDKVLGTLYTVTGKNAYGAITLMVAISANNTVYQVEFLENGQSFASTVNSHVKANYHSSKEEVYELNPYSDGVTAEVGDLSEKDVENINVKCGATYGATLVKELVNIALADAKGGK